MKNVGSVGRTGEALTLRVLAAGRSAFFIAAGSAKWLN